jgi:hypothetical protein
MRRCTLQAVGDRPGLAGWHRISAETRWQHCATGKEEVSI